VPERNAGRGYASVSANIGILVLSKRKYPPLGMRRMARVADSDGTTRGDLSHLLIILPKSV
jgi:hypothetical protein